MTPDTELQTVKEELIRLKTHFAEIEKDIKEIREILAKKRIVIFGDGEPGLTSKVAALIEILNGVKDWQNGWREVTNYEDFRAMRTRINLALQEVDSLKKWVYIGIGGVWVITILLQIFGPGLISKAAEILK